MGNTIKAGALAMVLTAGAAGAASDAPVFQFPSIDGGTYDTAQWRGLPVLVVNTASMCGFTPQYEGLQALSDAYKGRAVVLAVPSATTGRSTTTPTSRWQQSTPRRL